MTFKRNFKKKLYSFALIASFVLSIVTPAVAGTTARITVTGDKTATELGLDSGTCTVTTPSTSDGGVVAIDGGSITGNIGADFIDNTVSKSGGASGGAIYNQGTITGGIIGGSFKGNKAEATTGISNGGAIYNDDTKVIGVISNVTFENNTSTGATQGNGGAIFNQGNITGGITGGSFKGNKAEATTGEASGGAIANSSTIKVISNVTFENNTSAGAIAGGGAIYNQGTITDGISGGSFKGNKAEATTGGVSRGGAILSNTGKTIKVISNVTFENNTSAGVTEVEGGAIYNGGTITDGITGGSFKGNKVEATTGDASGGAIANSSTIKVISNVTFENNTSAGAIQAGGGAIYNQGTITDGIIGGSFKGNKAEATTDASNGGAIANSSTIKVISNVTFENNTSTGATYAQGGAISNWGTITDGITGGSFTGNKAKATADSGLAYGGAIASWGSIGDGTTTGIIDSSFTDNCAEATGAAGYALGGAIVAAGSDLLIKANTKDVTFSGNYVSATNGTAAGSAIYVGDPDPSGSSSANLILEAASDRTIIFADDQTVEGYTGSTVAIKGAGTVEFSQLNDNTIYPKNAGIYGGTVTVDDTAKLVLSGAAQISAALTVNSSSDFLFDFAKDSRVTNHEFDTINFGSTAGNGTLTLDADLAEVQMDSIMTKTTSTVSGNTELHVTALSLFNDAKEDKTEIPFTTDSNLKEITKYDRDGEELASHANKYIVNYDKTTGKFIFKKSGVSNTTIATGDTVNVMNFVWLETVNNLQKRLGDLRGGEESDMAWARFQRNNDDHKTSRQFNVSGNLYQVGYDFALKNQVASRGYFGVSLEAFDGTQSYKLGGGDVKSMSLGAYYTKIYDSGHYFDFILRYGRLENDSTSYDATAGISGILTKLDYAMNSVTLSGEYGYRANLGKSGLYLEPQAEFIYGYLSGAKPTSSTNILADIDSTNHFVTRLGLAFGQRVKNFNYYLRGSYYHDFAGTIHIKYGTTPYQQDSAQNWWEVSLGGGWNISKLSYFYAELTKHFKDVSNSLNFNVGFRFTL